MYRFFVRCVSGLGVGIVVVLALWFPGLVWFVASVPDRVEDTATSVDAIVVLTGGSERLQTGLDLLREGAADHLFVSGVWPGTTRKDLLQRVGIAYNSDFGRKVELGHIAANTVGNAWETAIQIQEQGWTSVRLVTANYHMRRSMLELRTAAPHVTIIPHPVFPPSVMLEGWWRYPGTAVLLATEYTKYVLARARLLLPDPQTSPVHSVARASLDAVRTFLVSEM